MAAGTGPTAGDGLGSVDDAVAFLQKCSSISGETVFDHLTNVIQKILEERPSNAVDLLETSVLVKRTKMPGAPEPTEQLAQPVYRTPEHTAVALAALQLYGTPEPPINEDTGEPEEADPPNEYETENLLADAALFEATGVGLGTAEMYRVMLAIKHLGQDPQKGIATVRFFGKIFGTLRNYYVFESTLKEPPTEDDEAEAEPEWGRPQGDVPKEVNVGTNEYTYWVCSNLGGAFTKLPDVTPLQIKTARSIKKFLTGDLKAEASAYPPFPGTEAEYLRAQIARIAATTIVCPTGFFRTSEEEDGPLEKNDEYIAVDSADLVSLDAWAHRYPHIKQQGRCTLYTPPPPEDEEEAEAEPPAAEEEDAEVSPAPLTTLDNDGLLASGGKAWTITFSSSVPGLKYKVACARSLLWPGAHAIVTPTGFSNVYIGWAMKNAPYSPPMPPAVQQEWAPKEDEQPLLESTELPPRPAPPEEEGQGEEGDEEGDGEGDGEENEEEGEEEEEEDA